MSNSEALLAQQTHGHATKLPLPLLSPPAPPPCRPLKSIPETWGTIQSRFWGMQVRRENDSPIAQAEFCSHSAEYNSNCSFLLLCSWAFDLHTSPRQGGDFSSQEMWTCLKWQQGCPPPFQDNCIAGNFVFPWTNYILTYLEPRAWCKTVGQL